MGEIDAAVESIVEVVARDGIVGGRRVNECSQLGQQDLGHV
jgi:hypothetical protein